MSPLIVEVHECDIVVRRPETGHSVTYRRAPDGSMLIALDPLRDDPDKEKAKVSRRSLEECIHQSEVLASL